MSLPDHYNDIPFITREEALAMIPQIFSPENDELWRGIHQSMQLAADVAIQYDEALDSFIDAWVYSAKLLRATGGFSPDYRAICFPAADLPDTVYCFAYLTSIRKADGTPTKALFYYNGRTCPIIQEVIDQGQIIWMEGDNG